nr:proline-alanine-rich protein [Rose latent virus]
MTSKTIPEVLSRGPMTGRGSGPELQINPLFAQDAQLWGDKLRVMDQSASMQTQLVPAVGTSSRGQTAATQAAPNLVVDVTTSLGGNLGQQASGLIRAEPISCSLADRTNSLLSHPLLARGQPVPEGGVQPHLAFRHYHAEPADPVYWHRRRGVSCPPHSAPPRSSPSKGRASAPKGERRSRQKARRSSSLLECLCCTPVLSGSPTPREPSPCEVASPLATPPAVQGDSDFVSAAPIEESQLASASPNPIISPPATSQLPETFTQQQNPFPSPCVFQAPAIENMPFAEQVEALESSPVPKPTFSLFAISPDTGFVTVFTDSSSPRPLCAEDIEDTKSDGAMQLIKAYEVASHFRRAVLGEDYPLPRRAFSDRATSPPSGTDSSKSWDMLNDIASTSGSTIGPVPVPEVSHADALAAEERITQIINRDAGTKRMEIKDDMVKFGDNSIHTNNTNDLPIYQLAAVQGQSDFFSRGISEIALMSDHFVVSGSSLRLRSFVTPLAQPLTVGESVEIIADILHSENAGFNLNEIDMLTVELGPPIAKGSIDRSLLTPYMIGEVPNSRTVTSAITPELRPANRNLLPESAGFLDGNLSYFDNSLIYAKLVWHALMLDVYQTLGINALANPFPANPHGLNWVNLSDANLSVSAFTTPFTNNSICLLEGRDFSSGDYQVLQWLAYEGRRLHNDAAATTPNCCYVNWPKVRLCLLGHGARPANLPDCALLTSAEIFAFTFRLAESRGEWDDCLRGSYLAFDLMGVRYGTVEGHTYPTNTFMGLANLTAPAPADYNLFCRLLKLGPQTSDDARVEMAALMAHSPNHRAHAIALYVAAMRTFSTTVLHSLSIQTQNLVDWCNGTAPATGVNMVLLSGMVHPVRALGPESIMFSLPKVAFEHFLGYRIVKNLYPGQKWLPHSGALTVAQHHYAHLVSDINEPPRAFSALVIDDFILTRPQEWCVLGSETQIDFFSDLVAATTPGNRGVFSDRGDATYNQRLNSANPYLFVPYGVQLLNAICQHFELGSAAPHYRGAVYNGAGGAMFNSTPATYATHKYIASLFIYEPCSIMTFDWSDSTVRAPCFYGTTRLTQSLIRGLKMWRGANIPEVGFILSKAGNIGLSSLAPPPFANFGGLVGVVGNPPGGADGAPADVQGNE